MVVTVHRHATAVRTHPGNSVSFSTGELLGTHKIEFDPVPAVGDLITVHPDGRPSLRSWTAEVTGRQFVVRRSRQSAVVLTVRDDRETS